MTTVHHVADYIAVKIDEAGASLNLLKLQKLLYYVQAWSLATRDRPAFQNKFQAWVHGPVCREIYDRFKDEYSLYDSVRPNEAIRQSASAIAADPDMQSHIDEVLEAYARFSGTQLEAMTHREEPWIRARGERGPAERCEVEIDEQLMTQFYANLLKEVADENQRH